jgi:two-component system LytT family sensor kinase
MANTDKIINQAPGQPFRFAAPSRAAWLTLLCWSLFIGFDIGVVLTTQQKLPAISIFATFYAVNISLFYAHISVLNYTFKRPGRPAYWKGVTCLLAVFIGVSVIKGMLDVLLVAHVRSFSEGAKVAKLYLPADLIRNCYFIIFATFYWVGGNIADYRRKALEAEKAELRTLMDNAELQTRLAESRNAYLQQQVNPHMLFNALSFIHSHVYKSSTGCGAMRVAPVGHYAL